MNNRPISAETTGKLFSEILNKLDKAEGKEFFYACMALARGIGRKFNQD